METPGRGPQDSQITSPQRTAESRTSANPDVRESITDYRRGDITGIRLPGLMLSEQRIRRAIRRLRDNVLPDARNAHTRGEIEEVLRDLHIAIDAIQ